MSGARGRPETFVAGRRALILAAALACVYPFALAGFHAAIDGALRTQDGGIGPWSIALGCMVLAYAIPLAALWMALHLAQGGATPAAQRMALLVIAAPPILNLLSLVRAPVPDIWVWAIFWVLALIGLVATGGAGRAAPQRAPAGAALLRRLHGAGVIGIGIAAFLLFHVGNQLSGLSGAAAYDQVMRLGRLVYRAAWVEPLLVSFVLLQLLSGLYLLWRDSVAPHDRFRTLQIAAGCYLIFFLLSHLNATLLFGRRVLHGNTGFSFATGGPDGLLRAERLIPYYGLAVFFALLHVALGLRRVLLRRNVRQAGADGFVVAVAAVGGVVALAIMVGLCSASLPRT
jgi:hypothetical protein